MGNGNGTGPRLIGVRPLRHNALFQDNPPSRIAFDLCVFLADVEMEAVMNAVLEDLEESQEKYHEPILDTYSDLILMRRLRF